MIKEQRTYVIPLRREFSKAPRYLRSKKAVKALKEFIIKHTKTKEIIIDPLLNEYIWAHGIKNPPSKVKVNVIPLDSEKEEPKVRVELAELPSSLERKKNKLIELKKEAETKKKATENQLENLINKKQETTQEKQQDSKESEEKQETKETNQVENKDKESKNKNTLTNEETKAKNKEEEQQKE